MKRKVTFKEVSGWAALLMVLRGSCGDCEDCKLNRKELEGLYETLRLCPVFYYSFRLLLDIPDFPDQAIDEAIDGLDNILESVIGAKEAAVIIEKYESQGPLALLMSVEELASKIELELPVDDDPGVVTIAPTAEA